MVRSFGAPAEPDEPAPGDFEPELQMPAAGLIRVAVDLVLTPDSLSRLEQSLTATVARAVMAGFAQAAMENRN